MVFAAGRGKSAVKKAPAAPKPVNLPSLKREHSGYDPNVALVPSGGAGWNNVADGIPGSEPIQLAPQAPKAQPAAPAATPETAGMSKGQPGGPLAPPPQAAHDLPQRSSARAYSSGMGIGGGGFGGGLGDRHQDTLGSRLGDRFGGQRPGYDRPQRSMQRGMKSGAEHFPELSAGPDDKTDSISSGGTRPQVPEIKIDMVQVRDDGTGWADDSSDEEMTYDEDKNLFDDMLPSKATPASSGNGDKRSDPSSPPPAAATSPPLAPEDPTPVPAPDREELARQNELMKSKMKATALQARERREAEEREQERQRKENAARMLKKLEDDKSAKSAAAVQPVQEKPVPKAPAETPPARPVASDISNQGEVMKSTALQARERREAEEREQERLRKERAEEKLKELDAKAAKAKEEEAARQHAQGQQQNSGDDVPAVTIMERPREQSRFNLWVDPDSKARDQKKDQPAGKPTGKETPRGFDTASKFKPDDRDWRARDPAGSPPAQNFVLARRPGQNSDQNAPEAKTDKSGGKGSNHDGSKQNRRDKEQKKREQAASLIDIPKPLPIGTSAPVSEPKQNGESKKDGFTASGNDSIPSAEWPVKRMRKFCEEHLIQVTRSDTSEAILKKIEQSRFENGGVLKQKGQKKKGVTSDITPKPRPSGAAQQGEGKEDDRRDRRRERETKQRERRKKDNDDKADKADGDGKDKVVGKDKDRESSKESVKDKDGKDKTKAAADDKSKSGVPTLEAQGLQPIADGLMVGMGVAVAQGEVLLDNSGFTTVVTGDKNQRKEEQKKREAAREKEQRDKRQRERREKQAAKIPTPAPAPKPGQATQPQQEVKATGEDISLGSLDQELDLTLHDAAPRPHSIQDLNQQAAPKVAWGGQDSSNPTAKKPVSLLQVQVEEKFNKRLDPQFDVELEPQRQGSSSAIGSERRDGPCNQSDLWAAASPAPGHPVNEGFSTAFQSAIGAQAQPVGVMPNDFNPIQGLRMLQIQPSSGQQPFSAAPDPNLQPRYQALGLARLGGTDPFASAFGAPGTGIIHDNWNPMPGVGAGVGQPQFAVPGASQPMSFVPESAQSNDNSGRQWSQHPRNNAVGHQRAVGGGKRGVQVAPGPANPSDAVPQHGHVGKRHGRHGKGGNGGPGPVGGPSGGNDNSSGGKGQKQHKNGGNKQGGRRRGPKDGGDNGGGATVAATPRPAGEANGKASNNNRRGPRRGNGKQRGDKPDSGGAVPAPIAAPAPSM